MKTSFRCASILREVAAAADLLLLASVSAAQGWPQWALNPQHTGNVNVSGQPLNSILASIVYDPLVPQEMAADQGNLLAHYQVPLIQLTPAGETNIYMEFKSGSYN